MMIHQLRICLSGCTVQGPGGSRRGETSDSGQEHQRQRERLLPVHSAMLRRSRFASTLVQRIGRDGPAVGRRVLTASGVSTAQAATLVPQRNPRTAKLVAKPHVRYAASHMVAVYRGLSHDGIASSSTFVASCGCCVSR